MINYCPSTLRYFMFKKVKTGSLENIRKPERSNERWLKWHWDQNHGQLSHDLSIHAPQEIGIWHLTTLQFVNSAESSLNRPPVTISYETTLPFKMLYKWMDYVKDDNNNMCQKKWVQKWGLERWVKEQS